MPNEKSVYHWSEIRWSNTALYPEMMAEGGFNVPIKCRLKGQGNMGITGVGAELRTVNCDINYCHQKIGRMLKKFSYPEQKKILEGYLESIGANTFTEDDAKKDLSSWEAEIQQSEMSAHHLIALVQSGGLSDA